MITTQGIGAMATHTVSLHLLPGAVAVLGGVMAWNLWQQRRQKHELAAQRSGLTRQLDELQGRFDTLEAEQKAWRSSASAGHKQASAPNGKRGLFERLIKDNIAIRKAS